jgi:AraC-like DNA-binding protein
MTSAASGLGPFRFSTDDLPDRDRVAAFRELFGRKMAGVEFEALEPSFWADITLRGMSGIGLASAKHSRLRLSRTAALLADGNDALVLQISTAGGLASQFGREVLVGPGDGILLSNADVSAFTCSSASECVVLSLPREDIRPPLGDLDSVLVRRVPRDIEALELLRRYVGIFGDAPALTTPALQHLAVTHVYDLVALALGATRDAAAVARGRGLRAARVQEILAEIRTRFADPAFSSHDVARKTKLSERYLQDLLQETGSTFTARVTELRLQKARAMLANPHHDRLKVSEIAYACGFNEVSHFNRSFRARFGASPTACRGREGAGD